MSRIRVSRLLLAGILIGCARESVAEPTQPSPRPASPPLQLTITNLSSKPNTNEPKTEQAFEVKDAGNLYISFPATWENKLTKVLSRDHFFDSIMFRPRGGGDFELMLDVNNVGGTAAARIDVKGVVQRAGQTELANSVEKTLDIHEVRGAQTTVYYFVVTDKNYNPDHPAKSDYRYLTQGYAKLDGLILSFRLVSNHLPPEQEQTLEMIKTVRFEKKP